MKKTINTFFLLVITGLVVSCGPHSEKKDNNSNTEQTEEHQGHETELSLDNGKVWLANPETTSGIKNMAEIMNSFTDKEEIGAYSILKENLETEFGLIFQNCTMTGEAHNQLHNYLHPIIEMLEGIGSSDLNTCKTNFDKLKEHLAEYSNYFE